jgi:hypothetical protein
MECYKFHNKLIRFFMILISQIIKNHKKSRIYLPYL